MTANKEGPPLFRFDVAKLTFDVVTSDLGRTLRINGYQTKTDGVYVLMPLSEMEQEPDPDRRAALLVADLTNAFQTMVYLYSTPEEAEKFGIITPLEKHAIQGMKDASK